MKIRAAIAGATGYTGGELLRILLRHPDVEVVAATTTSSEGTPVSEVHRDLLGETDLRFGTELNDPDVLFLCLGHGLSREFIDTHDIKSGCRIIDLGNDFRLDGSYAGRNFVYGLCEQDREACRGAHDIANPGCFATAIQLALLPLASAGLLTDEVHVTAITGSTGAGKKLSETSHFSYRTDNISIYKAFEHQHLKEIGQSIRQLQAGFAHDIDFIPVRGDFTRGIFVTAYTKCNLQDEEARQLYENFYADAAFTFVAHRNPDLKQVVNTNKAIVYTEKHGDKLLIVSMIDNLLKGASGQAVQNMNLIFGLDEKAGLNLKAGGF